MHLKFNAYITSIEITMCFCHLKIVTKYIYAFLSVVLVYLWGKPCFIIEDYF